MIGNKNNYSWLWAALVLFSAGLNIVVQASVLLPVSKVQPLREADSEIKLHKRNGWKAGRPEERAFGLHLLVSRQKNSRVKRYDRNAWKNWKPGDPDPFADTQADYKRQYNAEQASKRRQKEANRRHREEVARLSALDIDHIFCSCRFFCFFRSNAYYNEVANPRNRSLSWPMIAFICILGLFVCCGCLAAFCKCKDDHCSGSDSYVPGSNVPPGSNARQNEEINYRSGAGLQQLQDVSTRTNASSTQRAREGASSPSHATAPLLPDKPPSDENGPELPPSYAAAMADSS